MELEVQLTGDPIAAPLPPPSVAGAGAGVEFRGVVRGEEQGQPIAALEYEAYAPMAEREMRRILGELTREHDCLAVRVIHRIGVVPVGETAIYIGVAARHRKEALALPARFMDRLKQDVPIWKRRALRAGELTADRASRTGPDALLPRDSHGPVAQPARPDEVIALLREFCHPLETERVPLAGAGGRVLREAACASEDQPPFDRSAVDGYAVRDADPATCFRVVGELRAGEWEPRVLQPGEAVGIATGAALPGDGLRVLKREDVRVEGDGVVPIRQDTERNIRFRGEDAQAGQVLVEPGTTLSPGALALLASIGITQPLVTRLPRVLHIATGDEIVPPGQTPGAGQIRDSNSTLVRAFLGQWGITPRQGWVGEEAVSALAGIQRLVGGAEPPDLFLISGGASVGKHDRTRSLLETMGFTIRVSKTAARPGKPLIVAHRGCTLALGLPGNPLAHHVCLNLYARTALESWTGTNQRSTFQVGLLDSDLTLEDGAHETYWPARWRFDHGVARVRPLRWRSSGDLTALSTADALIRVPPGTETRPHGSQVMFVAT